MFASRPVTGFATILARHFGAFQMQARVRAGGEGARNIGVTIEAGFVSNVSGAFNLERHNHRPVGRAGIEQ